MFIVLAIALAQQSPSSVETPPETETAPPAKSEAIRTYTLDPEKSFLGVLVRYDRDALMKGHDHVISPSSFEGTVRWGPDPADCDVRIAFPVVNLQVDPPGSRARFGLEGATSESDKRTIKKNMTGPHQLDAKRFPEIAFRSTSCTAKGDRFLVSGTLALHGVGAPVTAEMEVEATPTTFTAKGNFQADHALWGMKPFTALLGSLRNDDTLSFTVDVVGHAVP